MNSWIAVAKHNFKTVQKLYIRMYKYEYVYPYEVVGSGSETQLQCRPEVLYL